MINTTDQLNRILTFDTFPVRIVSVVPSVTELLADLDLGNEITGITKFCIHPDKLFRSKTRVGGTKKLNHTIIESLNPDLIVANKEENTKEDIELLCNKYPVWISDIKTLEDANDMIKEIGRITDRAGQAVKIVSAINSNFSQITPLNGISTLYLIWKKPYMAAGNDTFINDMLSRCGMKNVLSDHSRYPTLSLEELSELNPELVLLSSEPYPFKEKDIEEFKAIFPHAVILTVNGEYYSWYGSRLVGAPGYFKEVMKDLNEKRNFIN